MSSDRVLFIDPQKHYPLATKLFENADYYCPWVESDKIPTIQPGLMSDEKAVETYGVKILDEESLTGPYDFAVIKWPVNSLGYWMDARVHCMTPTTVSNESDIEGRRELFHSIFKTISRLGIKKVAVFDGNDSPLIKRGLDWLDSQGYHVDAVFKREYRRTHVYEYDKRVHPFPFFGGSEGKSVWRLFENRVRGNAGVNGCFWSGAPIYRFQAERPDEWCNRRDFLIEIQNYLVIKSGLPQEEFLNQFNEHRFFLHLNGTGHLCGRFFEGLSRDSLMMMQQMDVVFPFEGGDSFHEKCIVSTPREFVENILQIANDQQLYSECKMKQEAILEKYYCYEWMRNYIKQRL